MGNITLARAIYQHVTMLNGGERITEREIVDEIARMLDTPQPDTSEEAALALLQSHGWGRRAAELIVQQIKNGHAQQAPERIAAAALLEGQPTADADEIARHRDGIIAELRAQLEAERAESKATIDKLSDECSRAYLAGAQDGDEQGGRRMLGESRPFRVAAVRLADAVDALNNEEVRAGARVREALRVFRVEEQRRVAECSQQKDGASDA